MKNKALLGNIALILISLIFAFLLCEAVIRVLGLSPEVVYIEKWRVRLANNPKIAYEPIPNISKGQDTRYYGYDGMSNDLGFRDYDHAIEKKPNSKRILIIGDSITQGLWINDDSKIYSVVMEKKLRELGHDVDVMNMGVSGYNTQQEVETLIDKGLQYKPDLVILGYCLNDKHQDDGGIYGMLLSEEQKVSEGNTVNRSTLNPIVKHSDFLRFLRFAVFPQKETAIGENVKELYYENNVEKYFGVLGALSKQHGFDTNVFIFPDFGKGDENLLAGYGNYAFAEEQESIKALAAKNSLPYFDLYPVFKECHDEIGGQVSFDRYHPNPKGSECAGNKMAEYLSDTWF